MATWNPEEHINPVTGKPMKYEYINTNGNPQEFSDQWYWDEIEKYKGTDYYERLKNNPWLMDNQAAYTPGMFPAIGEALFGDYSARVNYYNGLHTQAQQYLDKMLSLIHEEGYDSAAGQVARDRLAGINPDLQGGAPVSAGSAAENDQPFNDPLDASGNSSPSVQQAFNIGSQFISTALSWVSAFQGMRSASLDNDLKSLGVVNGLQDGVESFIKQGTSEYFNGLEVPPGSSLETIWNKQLSAHGVYPVVNYFQERVHELPVSHRMKKKLSSMVEDFIGGENGYTARYQTMVNDLLSNLNKSRNNLASSSALPGASQESSAALRFLGNELYKPIADLQVQVERLILEGKNAYHGAFNSAGGPQSLAAGDIAAAKASSSMNSMKDDIIRSFTQIRKKIINSSDLSPTWKLALEASLSGIQGLVVSRVISGQSLFKSGFFGK